MITVSPIEADASYILWEPANGKPWKVTFHKGTTVYVQLPAPIFEPKEIVLPPEAFLKANYYYHELGGIGRGKVRRKSLNIASRVYIDGSPHKAAKTRAIIAKARVEWKKQKEKEQKEQKQLQKEQNAQQKIDSEDMNKNHIFKNISGFDQLQQGYKDKAKNALVTLKPNKIETKITSSKLLHRGVGMDFETRGPEKIELWENLVNELNEEPMDDDFDEVVSEKCDKKPSINTTSEELFKMIVDIDRSRTLEQLKGSVYALILLIDQLPEDLKPVLVLKKALSDLGLDCSKQDKIMEIINE